MADEDIWVAVLGLAGGIFDGGGGYLGGRFRPGGRGYLADEDIWVAVLGLAGEDVWRMRIFGHQF